MKNQRKQLINDGNCIYDYRSDSDEDALPQRRRITKEEEIYGVFLSDIKQNNDEGIQTHASLEEQESFVYKNKKQTYQQPQARINFFQEDFSRPKQYLQPPDETDERRHLLQAYNRQAAFVSFRKSNQTLNADVSQGVQVRYAPGHEPEQIPAYEKPLQDQKMKSAMRKGDKPKKSVKVTFQEERNQLYRFHKAQEEYLTLEEKIELSQRIQMHRFGFIEYDDEEIEEEHGEEQYFSQLLAHDEEKENVDVPIVQNHWKQTQEQQEQVEDQEEEEEDDFIVTRDNIQDLFKRRNFSFEQKKKTEKQKREQSMKPPEKKVKTNAQKHQEQDLQKTYDKGFEMLKKMGYKTGTGLGKNEQGRIKPVEAVMKKALVGAGDEYMDIEYEEQQVIEEVQPQVDKGNEAFIKLEKLWKKKKGVHKKEIAARKLQEKREKEVEKAISEKQHNLTRGGQIRKVLQGEIGSEGLKFVDMTGNNGAMVYDTIENFLISKTAEPELDISSQNKYFSQKESYQEGFSQLQNINQNLQNQVDKLYNKIMKLENSSKSEQDKITMFNHEYTEKEKQIAKNNQIKEQRNKFLRALEDLRERVDSVEVEESLRSIPENFYALFKAYPQAFIEFNIHILDLKVIAERIENIVRTWEGPKSSSAEDQLVLCFSAVSTTYNILKEVFSFKKQESLKRYSENLGTKYQISIQNKQITVQDLRVLKRFSAFLIKPIIQKLRSFVINSWEPENEKDFSLLDFVEQWSKTLFIIETDDTENEKTVIISHNIMQNISAFSPEQQQDILDQLVLPKLYKAIDKWTYRQDLSDSQYLHVWVLPWYIYIKQHDSHKIKDLNNIISPKLSQILQHWQPQQLWGLPLLSPWKSFMDSSKWEAIMLRTVVPKLMHMLSTEFRINPADQDISTLKIALQWVENLTDEQIQILFEGPVIEQISDVFNVWKEQGGNTQEIKTWLKGWELLLGKILSRVLSFQTLFQILKNQI